MALWPKGKTFVVLGCTGTPFLAHVPVPVSYPISNIHCIPHMFFKKMMYPRTRTCIGYDTVVLRVCASAKAMKEGLIYFNLMKNVFWIVWRVKHYLGVTDIHAKIGHLNEAEEFIKKILSRIPVELTWHFLFFSFLITWVSETSPWLISWAHIVFPSYMHRVIIKPNGPRDFHVTLNSSSHINRC